jgi:hypothetical protein
VWWCSYIVQKQLEKTNRMLMERTADAEAVEAEVDRIQEERSEDQVEF